MNVRGPMAVQPMALQPNDNPNMSTEATPMSAQFLVTIFF